MDIATIDVVRATRATNSTPALELSERKVAVSVGCKRARTLVPAPIRSKPRL
jgi:hypothetical protein